MFTHLIQDVCESSFPLNQLIRSSFVVKFIRRRLMDVLSSYMITLPSVVGCRYLIKRAEFSFYLLNRMVICFGRGC